MNLAFKSYKLYECNISVYLYCDRHFRINKSDEYKSQIDDDDVDDTMKYFDIYREIIDSLHFYVFHLMTSGLRMYTKQDLNENDEYDTNNSPYFDRLFSRISDFIKNSKEKTNRFTRLSGNKFNISAVNDVDDINVSNGEGDDTFLDGIYQHLSLNKNNNPLISKLVEIIKSEEYDTCSIDIDLDVFVEYGVCNISLALNNDDIVNQMIEQFNKSKSSDVFIFTQT